LYWKKEVGVKDGVHSHLKKYTRNDRGWTGRGEDGGPQERNWKIGKLKAFISIALARRTKLMEKKKKKGGQVKGGK